MEKEKELARRREHSRNHYQKNKKKLRKKQKQYYQNHKSQYKDLRKAHYRKFREELRESARKYYHENKDKVKEKRNVYRNHALAAYSTKPLKCALCGENDIRVLELDHIGGGGSTGRNKHGGGYRFYVWLANHNYPKTHKYFPRGLRVLCRNCNWRERLRT